MENARTVQGSDRLFCIKETAEIWGVHQMTVWRLIKDGPLPSVKIGRVRRIRRDAVENPPQVRG